MAAGSPLAPASVFGQGAPPAPPAAAGGGLFESQTGLQARDDLVGGDSHIDWESGVFTHKGTEYDMGDGRVMRARFERYLLTPVPELDYGDYREVLTSIEFKINPDTGYFDEGSVMQAWSLLYLASDWEIDGGNSELVGNLVYNIWRIRDEHRQGIRRKEDLERQRKYEQQIVASRAAFLQRRIAERQAREAQQGGRNRGGSGGGGAVPLEGEKDLEFRRQDLAETEARIKLLEAQMVQTATEAKIQFQNQIVAMLAQRRYHHVIIACRFYDIVFKGTNQKLEDSAAAELSAMMPASAGAMDIRNIEYMAREAITDVQRGIAAVNAGMESGQLSLALERLQETYFLGENTLPVLTFPEEKKLKLLEIYRKGRTLRQLIENRDFLPALDTLEDLVARTDDFPVNEGRSRISTNMKESNMHLTNARHALSQNDYSRVARLLGQAVEAWPMNPDAIAFKEKVSDLLAARIEAQEMFDFFLKYNDRRTIYERRNELYEPLRGDARVEQLKKITEDYGHLDFLIGKALELEKEGDVPAAWELLNQAAEVNPLDLRLNEARVRVAAQMAPFIDAIEKAKRAERQGDFQSSLLHFFEAEDIFPLSSEAHNGVERVKGKLLEQAKAQLELERERREKLEEMRRKKREAATASASEEPEESSAVAPETQSSELALGE